jgi:hypothetical protein
MKKMILKGIIVAVIDDAEEQLALNRYYYVGKEKDAMLEVTKNPYFGQTEFPEDSGYIGIKLQVKTKKSQYELAFRDYPQVKEVGEQVTGNISYFKLGGAIGDEVSLVALPFNTIYKLFPNDEKLSILKGIVVEIVNDIYKIQVRDEYIYLKRHCFINNTFADVKEVFNLET